MIRVHADRAWFVKICPEGDQLRRTFSHHHNEVGVVAAVVRLRRLDHELRGVRRVSGSDMKSFEAQADMRVLDEDRSNIS